MDGQFDRVPAVHPGMIPAARRSVENLPSGRGVVDGERGRVLARYARLMRSGRPEVCLPGRREIEDRERLGASATGSDGKVIYPDRDAAECAARELEALGGRPQRAYLCRRSRRGHYHLTTDAVAQRRRDPAQLIPQPRRGD
ncbi:hypothetical protein Ae406Ps2_1763c [Pseudonocardia sp. Ae406_Ps2]|uniref:hypothetical protein n=1 Tax=unclassified Pseudonocardia TaxID=2619320 RepID=UPI00094B30F5|nr:MULTISPECIES: hypothetical protein [unclassified Pseudonocardia]OLM01763.1 hypothetical protein Ae406Ps2_1763c [Pseudonocardia sp. Ae406_Ps2]OLM06455.1 hypothetical protein Ae331Ps2_4165 [Pseudonocardia sp. Ae331_Ps2]OLM13192.1 hypothetical protein Ae505Ps2_3320 [Pseudonocardia sp. Ae505_Ps2]OLM23334.1 hypothetical protein Ae706Ps2_1767c [Pseudonocardia sp. Ae706_Ps2]OLM32389.1 hypothetical protein Ae717Ps2_3284c [Pseudonocardia sp. Ae717_Ps2]